MMEWFNKYSEEKMLTKAPKIITAIKQQWNSDGIKPKQPTVTVMTL